MTETTITFANVPVTQTLWQGAQAIMLRSCFKCLKTNNKDENCKTKFAVANRRNHSLSGTARRHSQRQAVTTLALTNQPVRPDAARKYISSVSTFISVKVCITISSSGSVLKHRMMTHSSALLFTCSWSLPWKPWDWLWRSCWTNF